MNLTTCVRLFYTFWYKTTNTLTYLNLVYETKLLVKKLAPCKHDKPHLALMERYKNDGALTQLGTL